ncbi:MAG: lipocalin family protein [Fidelibacterota bacterium]|nr:MAG: lipocalin family protein [Candidatus Neomarinimicrobiota bacterium]
MAYVKALLLVPGLFLMACAAPSGTTKDIKVVEHLDLDRYLGRWYEIARLPTRFEKGLVNVTATYSLRDDGRIKVLNQGYKETSDGEHSVAEGVAWIPDPAQPARLRVSFFWIFASDYKVIALDGENYQWAMVTSKSKRYLWVLNRTPTMDEGLYTLLVEQARGYGFDIGELYKVPQDW